MVAAWKKLLNIKKGRRKTVSAPDGCYLKEFIKREYIYPESRWIFRSWDTVMKNMEYTDILVLQIKRYGGKFYEKG